MKILIGAPARQNARIFKEFLKSLDSLELPEAVSVEKFFVINDCDELTEYLKPAEYVIQNTYDPYLCNEQTHHWTDENLWKMCDLRNILLDKIVEGGYDALFMVDTDLILHPKTLWQLLSNQKDLCAEVFWTPAEPSSAHEWANAWDFDQCAIIDGSHERWRKPGVYRVGGTGACFLISRRAIEQGCSYSPIPNIYRALKGEDRWFCIRAYCLGFEIFLDTHYPATHLYRMSEYERYMEVTYGDTR